MAFTSANVGTVLNELILIAKRAYRCKGDCKNLVATLVCIEPHLASVQLSEGGNVACQVWLKDLESLMVEAKGILQNCDKLSRCSLVKKFALSSKIQSIDRQIQGKLMLEGNLVTLDIVQRIDPKVTYLSTPSAVPPSSLEMQHVPFHTVAFENNPFKKLKDLILWAPSSGTTTIGLKGRGGVGKTLLAKMVNNDEQIQKKYGVSSILWITIGPNLWVSSLYKMMGNFLNVGGIFEREISGRDLEAQRTYLMEAFKKKRALVILDDIWGDCEKNRAMIYWLDICIGDGSTTLITTRDNKVLDHAGATERIEVESLSKEESWKLFSFHVFQPNILPSREVQDIAMEICNECKGLPLVLEVIGGALWDTKDEMGWKYALSCLKRSESWSNSATMEDELFNRLKYSYDILDDETKKCFLYFAAFPKDYHVRTQQLYSIWQAENLFGSCDVEDTFNTGRMNLIILADRSLIDLDDDGEHAKIHNVLRDLAMCIIRDAKVGEWAYECQFELGKVLETLPKIKETTKRVSFMGTRIMNFDPKPFINAHNLEICLLSSIELENGSRFSASHLWYFLSGMSCVLYLSLSEVFWFKELPKSIKELKSLTHLDLSGCTSLKELPYSIKELKSLMHLDLSECTSLEELPYSIKELKSLTHLDLSECTSLEELPYSIKELKSLTHLDLSECTSLKKLPYSIKELKSLTHLDLSECTSLKKLPYSIKELKSLTHLDLSECTSLKELPCSIEELKSLTHLDLSGCTSLKELPCSIEELKSLTHLDLSGCTSLKELPCSIEELKSLTHLDLSECTSLKELPYSIKELKSLTHLDLSECTSLKELPYSIEELKSLTHLDLSECTSLEELRMGLGLILGPVHEKKVCGLEELDLDRSLQSGIHLKDTQSNQVEGSSQQPSPLNLGLTLDPVHEKEDLSESKELDPLDSWEPKELQTEFHLKDTQSNQAEESSEQPSPLNSGLTFDPVHEKEGLLELDPLWDLWEPNELQTEIHLKDAQPNPAEGSSEHGSMRNLSSHERVFESDDHDQPVQRQLSMLSIFSDFLLFLCIFLEPLSNAWTCLTDQGRLLISSLILWLQTHTFQGYALPKRYKWRVNSRDLKTNRFLGQGCSGIVYETTWSGKRNLARKDFPGVESDVFEIEAARLVELGDFPYIVKSFCWTIDKQSCSLVMEYMRHDLYSVIQKRKGEQRIQRKHDFAPPFGLIQSIHLISQIALGLSHLHGQGIAHGDLKPSNVLVSSEASPISVKVADFGLNQTKRRSTTLVSHRARCLQTVKWKAPELFEAYLDSLTVDNLCTRPQMSSPEASENVDVFSDDRIMRAADVYSFALTCSHILGVQNWDPNLTWMKLRKLVLSGLRPQLPSECPSTLTSLIASCWAAVPQARPSFLDICRRMQVVESEEMPPSERTIFQGL